MDNRGIGLGADGYFVRDGRRVVPVGVNYWPGSAGVEMWPRWPADQIQRDLDLLGHLGLNAIRFFLRWEDFEPQAEQYDQRMFQRLEQFLRWCADRRIMAQPSLIVGFMSGGRFWPDWRGGRNVFADPYMTGRAAALAAEAAKVIAPFHEHLLGIDQGNELCCLPDSQSASPQSVIDWCRSLNAGIRSVYPNALIVSGNEQNQVVNDTGWRFGQQPGCDYYSMHGYPVPAWHSVSFDGMTDPLCQSLLPFYTKIARTFGPVMLQEFGTIVTFGARQQDAYLRAMLPAAWEAGANGFLWWCFRDITAPVHPYNKNGFESTLGLVDESGKVKPGLEYYVQFARDVQQKDAPTPPDGDDVVGVYFPRHYYDRDNQLNPGNNPKQLSRWLVMANHLLRKLGRPVRLVRGDQPLDAKLGTIVIPGAMIDMQEADALESWVNGGGRLIWHGVDPVNWNERFVRLIGARPVDYRAVMPVELSLFGQTWAMGLFPRNMLAEAEPVGATVLAADARGLPMVLRNDLGRGSVVAALPVVDEAIAAVAHDRAARDRWAAWYAGMLA